MEAFFYIKTLGCKVNQYDSQVIREQLIKKGYKEAKADSKPDICIVNTCCVTNRAQAKGRSLINGLARKFPDSKLIVTGCTVDYNPEDIGRKTDFVVSNENKFSFFESLPLPPGERGGLQGAEDVTSSKGLKRFSGRTRAFVKIQDGCEQFCSYCIVPYVRGKRKSREEEDIVNEVRQLADNGYREIVLTGIHLGDYGKDRNEDDALVTLIKELENIPDVLRIRLSSIEPQDITDDLIDTIANSKKICTHLHIPLQSGDDAILKKMNRRYTFSEYKGIIKKISDKIPGILFTTDIIVGFPGETEGQFLNSCRAVEEIGFCKAHIFPFSARCGTGAALMKSRIPAEEIKGRVKIIQKTASNTAKRIKKPYIGTLQEVLIERTGNIYSTGYTPGYIRTDIRGKFSTNMVITTKISELDGEKFLGEVFS